MTEEFAGYAFPLHGIDGPTWEGMELRDYLAAHALANAAICTGDAREYELKAWFGNRGGITREEIAAMQAYRYADALLRIRKAPGAR
jgi:hypothetical protein